MLKKDLLNAAHRAAGAVRPVDTFGCGLPESISASVPSLINGSWECSLQYGRRLATSSAQLEAERSHTLAVCRSVVVDG